MMGSRMDSRAISLDMRRRKILSWADKTLTRLWDTEAGKGEGTGKWC